MNHSLRTILITLSFLHFHNFLFAQRIGIGTEVPLGKMHVMGTEDISQLILDAYSTQTNSSPLIRLRKSSGTDLMWINSDHINNIFIGFEAGKINNAGGGGTANIFIGRQTGVANTSGYQNTAIGAFALTANTTGYQNTGIG